VSAGLNRYIDQFVIVSSLQASEESRMVLRHVLSLATAALLGSALAAGPLAAISPFGIWPDKTSDPEGSDTNGTESYTAISADTHGWVKKRWIDYIAPQVYWYIGFAIADYAKLVPWWARQVDGTGVQLYIGQADYRQGAAGQAAPWQDPAELSRHLTFDQAYPQVAGHIHFSAKDMDADRIGAASRMVADHYARPALVPLMPRLGGRAPHRPRPAVEGSTVTWRPVRGAARYAVYRFGGPAAGCDLDEAHRVAVTGGTSFTDGTAEPARAYTYVVTALDRMWNESWGTPAGLRLRHRPSGDTAQRRERPGGEPPGRCRARGYLRLLISSVSCGATWNRSPTTP
jgi:hypothetical protein